MELNREQLIEDLEWKKLASSRMGSVIVSADQIASYYALIKELTEERDNLKYTLMGVMHSVDKWLDGEELKQDEVNRAATMREKTLQIVENLTDENEDLKAIAEQYRKQFEDAKVDTIREMCAAFALHFGTYTGKDTVKVVDVFKLLDQIANEMCRCIDERNETDVH